MSLEGFDKVLAEFAEEVNLASKRELGSRRIGKNTSYGVASRALQKSLTYSISGGAVSFGSPLPYATFIHFGVNGTKKNRNSPYSFTSKQPPTEAFYNPKTGEGWFKDKPFRVRDKSGKFLANYGPRGGDRRKSAAYMIARAVKRNGIEGLFYYEKALENIVPQYREQLGEALTADLMKRLNFTLGNITIKPK